MKLATLQTVFFYGAGSKGMHPALLKPESHPVKTLFGASQLGFVGVERNPPMRTDAVSIWRPQGE